MNTFQRITIFSVFFLCLASFAQDVTFNYGDELTWKGELGQTVSIQYKDRGTTKQIEGTITRIGSRSIEVAGEFILITNILSISGSGTDAGTVEETVSGKAPKQNTKEQTLKPRKDGDLPITVFMLPMEGGVGEEMRTSELKVLAQYIDENYGPGQIIVLKVDSGGGAGRMWSDIRDTIFEVRENHRVISWIHDDAISAAAMTVYCCDEIYYTNMGKVGSCSGYRGDPNNPLSTAEQQVMITEMEKVIARSSRPIYLSGCMFLLDRWLTYDKDPLTGEITYYDTVGGEGEFSLSTGTNLTLTAKAALNAGLCDGIANTEEELLALLHLEGAEINTHGEELFHDWEKDLQEFTDTYDDLLLEFQSGDRWAKTQKRRISSQIKAGEKLLRWAKKLGETAEYKNFNEYSLELINREILNLKQALQDADG